LYEKNSLGEEQFFSSVLSPGRTEELPPWIPHRPGRVQLRHPVPLEKGSFSSMSERFSVVAVENVVSIFRIVSNPVLSAGTAG
jgi:hypothetical protein